MLPSQEIRIAGGREVHLRSLQPLGLYPANSIFIGDYLTTAGQSAAADFAMIRDAGFVLEGPDGQSIVPVPDAVEIPASAAATGSPGVVLPMPTMDRPAIVLAGDPSSAPTR
jgi:biotin synthase